MSEAIVFVSCVAVAWIIGNVQGYFEGRRMESQYQHYLNTGRWD